MTTEDPAEMPESIDLSKVVLTVDNSFNGAEKNKFAFKADVTDITPTSSWLRFILKVTEGEQNVYYTIKPQVASHNGDWIACATPITLNGVKYEMAICWSSFFAQINNG
ncbi:MAG: hypothetical protein IJX58_02195 [Clostridia bacterium]|nr:hypothetical protein [Clostridia bacterium]